ncbi:SDR family oxidoreductase [Arsenicicoccus bolidensis]|uniref:SDR family oxidoreductase n=1 Tax=Arsenicicoccus bolidensis TaxID=229480 RepID=UPI0028A5F32E|nr:SDR family oxidoreductase [Arsenicicoccus bolidensis]
MTSTTLATTGATGQLGGLVSRLLDQAGMPHRLVVRDPSSPRVPHHDAVTDVAAAEFGDLDAATRALAGVDVLFMVSASESADRLAQHRTFVDAAAAAGVQHVVYTSFLGAAPDATFTLARDHHATEEHIKASGMAWTFLRDSLYLDFTEALVGEDGVIRGPAGEGACAFVARADVARSAAAVLSDPAAHTNRTYDLTGPQALTLDEVASTISAVRGTRVSYHDETLDEAYASRAGYGAPDWQVDAWVSTYTAIADGTMATVSGAVHELTGSRPTSLEEYLRSTPPR